MFGDCARRCQRCAFSCYIGCHGVSACFKAEVSKESGLVAEVYYPVKRGFSKIGMASSICKDRNVLREYLLNREKGLQALLARIGRL